MLMLGDTALNITLQPQSKIIHYFIAFILLLFSIDHIFNVLFKMKVISDTIVMLTKITTDCQLQPFPFDVSLFIERVLSK